MRFLITGGMGFIGSHLVDSLISKNHSIVVIDNLVTGSRTNLSHLNSNPDFEFVNSCVTQQIDLEVDGIFNLACPASPPQYQKFPIETLKSSVFGSFNTLELAKKLGIRIFQASTSEIYGDPKFSPQSEDYWGNVNPVGLRSCYDEGKRAAETLFMDYHRQYSVDIRIARIFNTYGPRMRPDDGRVVSNFIVQALQNTDLTIYGDGSQVRSLCFIEDMVEGIERLFFSEIESEPINLGNPEPVSMLELAQEIIDLTNSKSSVRFHALPADDPSTREPNIDKAKNLLDWAPKVSRKVGLKRTIEYFSEILELS